MILYSDATTPFGRKCLVAALERNIPLEERFANLADPGDFLAVNPLNQIPALTTDEGACLFDSDVILQYLDTQHDGAPLIPAGADRFTALTRIHLGNGLIESTLLRIMETRRPDGEKSPSFITHLETRVARGLAEMERICTPWTGDAMNAEEITTACALGYVDFRYAHDWHAAAPKLAEWFALVGATPSMAASLPTREEPIPSPLPA